MQNISNPHIIPIMHCFDENYCLPAAVSFYSMLKYANKNYFYKLYVLHSDNISKDSQEKLKQTIAIFPNASLEFINKGGFYDDLWEKLKSKAHFSKDMFYKLSVASSFPQYDKMIVTDVDVLWQGDISVEFEKFKNGGGEQLYRWL